MDKIEDGGVVAEDGKRDVVGVRTEWKMDTKWTLDDLLPTLGF